MGSRGTRVVVLLTCLGVGALAVAGDPEPEELPPVILHAPQLLTPLETAGTGLAPRVTVELTVSLTGKVTDLNIREIDPSSDYDDLFEEELRRKVGSWRFAPALRNGTPVERELTWVLEFLPAGDGAWSPTKVVPGLEALIRDEEPAHARLMQIYTLPVERQMTYLRTLAEKAEKPFESANRRQLAHGGIVVVTDHPDDDAAQAILNTVRAAQSITLEVFGQGIPLEPPRLPLLLFCYRSKAQYTQFVQSVDGILETSGYFCPPGVIGFHAEHQTRQTLISTLVHEVVHATMYRYIVKPGNVLPRWISEGLADYLGNSKIKKGQLMPGEHDWTQVYRSQAFLWRGKSLSQLRLNSVRERIRQGPALTVEAIVSADRDTFYGENMGLYYAQSWLLVHFLRHGNEEWTDQHFLDFVLYVAEGYRAEVAFEEVYGNPPSAFEDAYREYARRF